MNNSAKKQGFTTAAVGIGAALAGAAVGAALSNDKTRKKIQDTVTEVKNKGEESLKKAKARIEAGKEDAKEEIQDISSRLDKDLKEAGVRK